MGTSGREGLCGLSDPEELPLSWLEGLPTTEHSGMIEAFRENNKLGVMATQWGILLLYTDMDSATSL